MSHLKTNLDALRIDRSKLPPSRPPMWPWLVLIALLLGGGGFYWWRTQVSVPVVETALVQVRTSGTREPATLLNGSGYVTARRSATVSSKITGKVIEVLAEEGQEVKEGQLLARLDASNVEASLRLAEARLTAAQQAVEETKPALEFAEREYKRLQELFATRASSQSDLQRAESEVATLRARARRQQLEVEVAQREIEQWQQQLDDTLIRAPFAGVVTSKNAQPGEMISPMSVGGFTRTGICTIVDMTSLEIEVDVNESYINRVQAGQPVVATLDSYPDVKFPAKVIAIIPTADRQKATVKVRVGFEQLDPRILPDMGVKVAFQSMEPAAAAAATPVRRVSIPRKAVRDDAGRDIVWVVSEGRAERRAIAVEETRGEETFVRSGLSEREKVVVTSTQPLTDGQRVKEKITRP